MVGLLIELRFDVKLLNNFIFSDVNAIFYACVLQAEEEIFCNWLYWRGVWVNKNASNINIMKFIRASRVARRYCSYSTYIVTQLLCTVLSLPPQMLKTFTCWFFTTDGYLLATALNFIQYININTWCMSPITVGQRLSVMTKKIDWR